MMDKSDKNATIYIEVIKTALEEYLDRAILEHKAADTAIKSIFHTPLQIQSVLNVIKIFDHIDAKDLVNMFNQNDAS